MDFEEIYRAYFMDVYRYICSLSANTDLAEEVTQETFVKALKAVEGFDGSSEVKAWLFTIARNTYYSHCRRQRLSAPEQEAVTDISLSDKLVDGESAFVIHQFLHAMEEPYKEVFSLRVFGELPFDRIGRLFGKSPGWARVTYHRAKKKLIAYLEELENEKSKL